MISAMPTKQGVHLALDLDAVALLGTTPEARQRTLDTIGKLAQRAARENKTLIAAVIKGGEYPNWKIV